jgi:multidrug efflux system membrane fusion protein
VASEDLRVGLPGKLMLMLGAVAAVGLAGWLIASRGSEVAKAAPESGAQGGNQAVPVFVAKAQSKDVPIILRGIGAVQAYNQVSVKSRVEGNIVAVDYKEGQAVHIGDLLIQIDPRPFQAALDQALGTQAKDQATLANAQLDLARYAAIVSSQLAVTRQQYDTQKALVAQLQGTGASDKAQVEAARVNLEYASIRSPINGIIGRRQVDIGNLVQANAATPLVVITQIQPIFVTFSVSGTDLTRVREALQNHPLAVEAYDGSDVNRLAVGRLTLVDNQVNQTTGMVLLKATFQNEKTLLWPGEFVNAHLVLDTVENGVTIPVSAVQIGPSGSFVYAVKPDSTVAMQKVAVTQIEANTALIGSGLSTGDEVVVSGQNGLYPGVKIAAKQGTPGQMNASQPEIGPEGVGSTGVNTPPPGAGGINPR